MSRHLVGALYCALACSPVFADCASIVVTSSPSVSPPPGGWIGCHDVTIEAAGSDTFPYQNFTISAMATGSEDWVGTITVKNTAPDTVIRLFIVVATDLCSVVRDPDSDGEVWIYSCVVEHDVGSLVDEVRSGDVIANHIREVRSGRNIWADITALGSEIETVLPDIETISVTGENSVFQSDGALRGNVHAIGEFAASKGIGSIEVARTIASADHGGITIQSGANIALIRSGNLADATITATDHDVNKIETTVGGWGGDPEIPIGFPADEEFDEGSADLTPAGSLSCDRLWLFDLAKDLRGSITNTSAPNAGLTWKIGRYFTGSASINLPTSGLTHQIIFGRSGTGAWSSTAHVKLNGTNLTGEPSYTNTATNVGGGSAGLATFDIHHESCNPVEGASALGYGPHYTCIEEEDCCERFKKAYIRMYGPITQTQSPAVTVKYRPAGSSSSFTAVSWGVVTAVSSSDPRTLEVSRAYNAAWEPGDNYEYLIEPIANVLKSDEVDGSPNVVDFDYTFTLTSSCSSENGFTSGGFDMNNDGRMTSADLVAWAASPRDVTADGHANAADVARLARIVARFSN